jgi:hypothetical protein
MKTKQTANKNIKLIKQTVAEYQYPQWKSEDGNFSITDVSARWASGAAHAKTRGAKYEVSGKDKVYRTDTLSDVKWWISQFQ